MAAGYTKQRAEDVKSLLEEMTRKYNTPDFIKNDPVSVPHRFHRKQDIEIAGFFSALFAWGRRETAINKANQLMNLMDVQPYEFICNANTKDFKRFESFCHRTFQGDDILFLIAALRKLYHRFPSMEDCLASLHSEDSIGQTISNFRKYLLESDHLKRSAKHLPDPARGSAAKRLNLFLRWMVRKDQCGVDFGIWDFPGAHQLKLPLDVHSGKTARMLGLLSRPQNDWKAVEEVSSALLEFDPHDPVKYDYALFGLGIFEKWGSFTQLIGQHHQNAVL
jgi:uncharacterized protein (TIGR02757 family)